MVTKSKIFLLEMTIPIEKFSIKLKNMITIEDFKKVEIVVGEILAAEKIEGTDKLLKLRVDFGDYGAESRKESCQTPTSSAAGRQIVSGISLYFPDCSLLVGKKCMFVANLEPKVIRGIESEGMILAVSTLDGKFSLLEPNNEIPVGARAK